MIKIENAQTLGWEHAIRGMRNPYSIDGAENNSWEKSDSGWETVSHEDFDDEDITVESLPSASIAYKVGPNDQDLMKRLRNGGPVHAKYRRMITVYVDITAPLYW